MKNRPSVSTRPTLTTWREPRARYLVRELPWLKGSQRRVIDRCRYFHEACRIAERLSADNRQLAVECDHVTLGVWLNAAQVLQRAAPG